MISIEQVKIMYVSIDDLDVYEQLTRVVVPWAEGECNFCCPVDALQLAIDEHADELAALVDVAEYCAASKFNGDIIFSYN